VTAAHPVYWVLPSWLVLRNKYLATHNGGERWPGNEKSPEYQTILQWIRGARLTTSSNNN